MSAYWQAKIWGLLHDPALKALHNNIGRGDNSFWQQLEVMEDWVQNQWNPEKSGKKILEHIHLADYIASASDRGAIGSVSESVNYAPGNDPNLGLEISHLLSGEKLNFKLKQHNELIENRRPYLNEKEEQLLQSIPEKCRKPDQYKQLFWWLWRCLPEAVIQQFQDESLLLMPAETRLPDSSIWSHASITAALAGALAGYDLTTEDIKNKWSADNTLSHPYLATFSFSPIQELIKASRKMRDFWAGSWILHYLSACVSWKLANIYGPDCLLYPSLFQQPLIDHWLRREYPEFEPWVKQPRDRQLLTAGFPNVLVLILPKGEVEKAMQTARQTLLETWSGLSEDVLENLQKDRHWMRPLATENNTWKGWLNSQWQTYWSAVPIGVEGEELKNAAIPEDRHGVFEPWVNLQNQAYNLTNKEQKLFLKAELDFLREAYQKRLEKQGRRFSVNIGSWWPYIFDQTRLTLATVKNARNWKIPTAFGPRSTLSGIGPVVHPGRDWITEGETQNYWKRDAGLFDGIEQLNATETVKRGLEKILSKRLVGIDANFASYPDLTAGVAGYLKVHQESPKVWEHFQQACEEISGCGDWVNDVLQQMHNKWGIPWMDESGYDLFSHPRLLNAGWLVEDARSHELISLQKKIDQTKNLKEIAELKQKLIQTQKDYRSEIEEIINHYYPSNNPADWYILAAGDGDGMSEWLKGKKLNKYQDYIPKQLQQRLKIYDDELSRDNEDQEIEDNLKTKTIKFLKLQKRMGPSTHSALSRALLDFSNQLVPYLTEQRYAGRLIYGGGDDVLAYTNLWEWDKWLWDIRQCFRGDEDPQEEFDHKGNYWRWKDENLPENLAKRPLFTMGKDATISFGVVIAHHSVPLAIALENMWEAEKEAKDHKSPKNERKDAVQVRVIYGNGNILKATTKFDTFEKWHQLLNTTEGLESSLFETAATLWTQHPAPNKNALSAWTNVFCNRRDFFTGDESKKDNFQQDFTTFLKKLWQTTPEENLSDEIQYWLKLAAFVLRNRKIKLGGES